MERLERVSGMVVPGGFGYRGIEGKIVAARYARQNKLPYLGLCLGMQVMVIELARHAFDSDEPNSTEFNLSTKHPVIDLLPGTAYSRKLDLAQLFRLSIPGTYVVSVGYDPEAYFAMAGATAKRTKGLWLGKAQPAAATVTLTEKGSAPAPKPAAADRD